MPTNQKQNAEPLRDVFLKGILVHNPVLVQVIGICPVVAAAVSLRAAALLAGIYTLVLIVTEVLASAFLKKTIRWVRVMIYLLIGLAVVSPFSYLLEKNNAGIRITVGIYLSLLAANSLAVLRCEKIAVKNTVKYTFFDSLAASIGYSAVFLLVGFIRELLGNGTILDKPVRFLPKAAGMLMPLGGFIILGFMAAALRSLIIRYYPQYAKAMMIQINPMPVTLKAPTGPATGDKTVNDTAEAPEENTPAIEPNDANTDDAEAERADTQNEDTPNAPDEQEPDPSESPEDDSIEQDAIVEDSLSDTGQYMQRETIDSDIPQNQPEAVADYPDSNGIDLKFEELLHFLEECDTTTENNGFADC